MYDLGRAVVTEDPDGFTIFVPKHKGIFVLFDLLPASGTFSFGRLAIGMIGWVDIGYEFGVGFHGCGSRRSRNCSNQGIETSASSTP